MRPKDEVLVDTQLSQAISDLSELKGLLLELLACDDQAVEPLLGFVDFKPHDPVHHKVWKVSTNVCTIARAARNSLNATKQVLSRAPAADHVPRANPECLACGKATSGRIRAGFCVSCDHRYRRRDRSVLPDRAAFIRSMSGAHGAPDPTRENDGDV